MKYGATILETATGAEETRIYDNREERALMLEHFRAINPDCSEYKIYCFTTE